MMAVMSNVIAACAALAAFAVAVVAGLFGGIDATSILIRALLAMLVCYPIGLVIGMICQHVVADHLQEPVPVTVDTGDDSNSEQNAQTAEEAKLGGED